MNVQSTFDFLNKTGKCCSNYPITHIHLKLIILYYLMSVEGRDKFCKMI